MASTHASQFRSNISFYLEIYFNHDCLSEPMHETAFKSALVPCASGTSNLHYALPGKHYKYSVLLFIFFSAGTRSTTPLPFSLSQEHICSIVLEVSSGTSPLESRTLLLLPVSRTRVPPTMASLSEIPGV
jgi:hypothetical protein